MTEPSDASPAPRQKQSRKRRWRRLLVALAAIVVSLSLLTRWLLHPEQLVPLILDRVGEALALEITAGGSAEVLLRGEPQLVIRDLVAREPGNNTAILSAKRVLLALPWSSLRNGGKDLTIKRVELDAPQLDLPALQAWLAKRPPGEETQIPTLMDGLRIINGRIDNDDWRIEDIDVRLPSLHPGQPVSARIKGRYLDAPTEIPFNLAVAMSKPANDAGIAVAGPLVIERGSWRMPATVTLSGPLHLGEDDLTIVPAKLGMSARYESGDTRLPFALGLYGPLRFDEATWVLTPVSLVLRGDDPVPDLDAHGALALGQRLVIHLDGVLPEWPATWPVLPMPASHAAVPMPFALRYTGKLDFSDTASLRLQREATVFDARFRLYDVLDWIDHTGGSPLPPLTGHVTTPQLDISGATLEGVEVVFEDDDIR